MDMTHKERIDRVLGRQEIDRPAVSFWRHFYDRENSRDDLIKVMVEFQRRFNWDIVKINSRASYHIEDWGAKFEFSNDPLQKPKSVYFPVSKPSDWGKIKLVDCEKGALGEVLSACDGIVKELGNEVYCVQTVFSPLSVAADLVESDQSFLELMHEDKNALHSALENITETFINFTRKLTKVGISGLFFATTEWASRDKLSEEEYLEFGRPYDLKVLKAAMGMPLNIIHVCKENNMLPLFRDYPGAIISWNPYDKSNLSIHQAAQIFEKAFLCGVNHKATLLTGPEQAIKDEITKALNEAGSGRLIIGPGCAINVNTPDSNLKVAKDTIEEYRYER